jgi:hypothetical protein
MAMFRIAITRLPAALAVFRGLTGRISVRIIPVVRGAYIRMMAA